MAADLEQDRELQVETKRGGLGELSVDVDGKRVFTGSRLRYPTPTSVVERVRAALPKQTEKADETS